MGSMAFQNLKKKSDSFPTFLTLPHWSIESLRCCLETAETLLVWMQKKNWPAMPGITAENAWLEISCTSFPQSFLHQQQLCDSLCPLLLASLTCILHALSFASYFILTGIFHNHHSWRFPTFHFRMSSSQWSTLFFL